jgi:hypothetical protein
VGNQFASGKYSIAECDRCGFRFKLKQLRALTFKRTQTNILVCRDCWEAPNPQVFLGETPVDDPQGVRNPRPDTSYIVAGDNTGGSRIFQWGWNPVGGARDGGLTPNALNLTINIGTVTVLTV